MISQIMDCTAAFNADGKIQVDIGGWDFVIAHIIGNSGTVTFKASNDAGAVTGTTDGNASTAENFTAIQGTNLATGSGATSIVATVAPGTLFKFNGVGRFLQLETVGGTVGELYLYCGKVA